MNTENNQEEITAVVYPDKLKTYDPLSIQDIRKNAHLIKQLFKEALVKDIDYGLTPGCGDKPGLFKPGAEKVMLMFKLGCFPEPQDLSTEDCIKYIVKTRIIHLPSGIELGYGLGSCSSDEDKYKWRKAVCDAEYDSLPDEKKRVKWHRDGNSTKQVRTNPADLNNTILKMACKRSKVDGVITTTAASDIFSQDVEDGDEVLGGQSEPTFKKPQIKKEAINTADFRKMASKYEGKCKACNGKIKVGDEVLYNPKIKGAYHPACLMPKEEMSQPVDGLISEAHVKTLDKLAQSSKVSEGDIFDILASVGVAKYEELTMEKYKIVMDKIMGMIDGK